MNVACRQELKAKDFSYFVKGEFKLPYESEEEVFFKKDAVYEAEIAENGALCNILITNEKGTVCSFDKEFFERSFRETEVAEK